MTERIIVDGSAPAWGEALELSLNKAFAAQAKRISQPTAPSCTVATLPAGAPGQIVFVTNEAGGAVLAFFDGAAWRRVTDRAVVS